MKIKNARTVGGPWHPAIHHAANVIDRVWRAVTGQHPRCTGLGEEGHSERSKHYGLPGDIRLQAIDIDADGERVNDAQVAVIDAELRARLGTDYDILWEAMGTVNAHLHVEYDPKPVEAADHIPRPRAI